MAAQREAPIASHSSTVTSFLCQVCMQPLKLRQEFRALTKEDCDSVISGLSAPSSASRERPVDQGEDTTTAPAAPAERSGELPEPASEPEAEEEATNSSSSSSSHAPEISGALRLTAEDEEHMPSFSVGPRFRLPGEEVFAEDAGSHHHSVKVAAWLFDRLSDLSEVDHPLCEECTDDILLNLNSRRVAAQEDSTQYSVLLHNLEEAKPTNEEVDHIEREIDELESQEKQLLDELEKLRLNEELLTKQAEEVQRRIDAMSTEERQLWAHCNDLEGRVMELEDERESVVSRIHQARLQYDALDRINIFNDVFHIWYDGYFGTINGFRLGRLAAINVPWDEINAAWGQAALMLQIMADKLEFQFENYRLIITGSLSRIECFAKQPKQVYGLYGQGAFRIFGDSKFNHAMVAFLECLNQLMRFIASKDPHILFPYRIEGEHISDAKEKYSIRFNSQRLDGWTRALKFMLTDMKWCLAWMCKQFPS